MASSYDIAACYFPNYHQDPRNEAAHGRGWTEWNLPRQAQFTLPFHPNVTMGWDASPRTVQSDAFQETLVWAKAFLDEQPDSTHILILNVWNEWTEGSYLEPDTASGLGYLETVKEAFG